jgi:hypothetical protein
MRKGDLKCAKDEHNTKTHVRGPTARVKGDLIYLIVKDNWLTIIWGALELLMSNSIGRI